MSSSLPLSQMWNLFFALLSASVAFAQPSTPAAGNRPTTHTVITIATGHRFQQVWPSSSKLEGLIIENNNTNGDDCWIFIGSGNATTAGSTLLPKGESYRRYWPFVPSEAIQATCESSGDTLSIETQQMSVAGRQGWV
ncbi:MAG TPA: hypothetical protein VGJ20_45175 [Xanthobacteraceae bacterium]|jgi:hypothetical protein